MTQTQPHLYPEQCRNALSLKVSAVEEEEAEETEPEEAAGHERLPSALTLTLSRAWLCFMLLCRWPGARDSEQA